MAASTSRTSCLIYTGRIGLAKDDQGRPAPRAEAMSELRCQFLNALNCLCRRLLAIERIVTLLEEGLLAAVAALGHVIAMPGTTGTVTGTVTATRCQEHSENKVPCPDSPEPAVIVLSPCDFGRFAQELAP